MRPSPSCLIVPPELNAPGAPARVALPDIAAPSWLFAAIGVVADLTAPGGAVGWLAEARGAKASATGTVDDVSGTVVVWQPAAVNSVTASATITGAFKRENMVSIFLVVCCP